MDSDLSYFVEANANLPLDDCDRDKIYDSVIDSIRAGDWEGHYTETGRFHFEYTRRPEDQQPGNGSHLYTGTLDTSVESIDFDFYLHLNSQVPGEPSILRVA